MFPFDSKREIRGKKVTIAKRSRQESNNEGMKQGEKKKKKKRITEDTVDGKRCPWSPKLDV